MAIKILPDVVSPLAVTTVNLVTEATAPNWNEWAGYICAAGGYICGFTGWGGDFMKNFGIASLPWAAKNIYERIRGTQGATRRMTFRPTKVSRYPAPAQEAPFQGVKLT
jgi:hypothetical protein